MAETAKPAARRILVTAGPTREPIDDVRFLSNLSSGRMGFAIAKAAFDAGHDVTLVCGPTPHPAPDGPRVIRVVTALEMHGEVLRLYPGIDAVFMTAAVADYRPEKRIHGKRKKEPGPWDLRLVRNPDILSELGREKGSRLLVGFALEAERGAESALDKLRRKNLDAIVLNAPSTMGADRSDFVVLHASGAEDRYISVSKDFLALRLVSLATKSRL